jgi:hypothetical protein
VYLFQCLVYVFLHKPARITLPLSVNFREGATGDAKGALFSTSDTEHPGFFS